MPTIFRVGPYQIKIYPKDHEPSHVHVVGPDREAKIAIETGEVIENYDISTQDLKLLVAFVVARREYLKEQWNVWQD